MSKIKLIFFKIGIEILRVIYAVMKLLPVKDQYVFITKLSETPPLDFRILVSALGEKCPNVHIVMLCKKMNNRVEYCFHMLKQMYYLATSRAIFLERSCLVVHILKHRESLRVVQLWHALGNMKKFGFTSLNSEEGQPESLAKAAHMHEGYTDVLISSFDFINDYAEGFNIDPSLIREIPLPRVDLLKSTEYGKRKRTEIYAQFPDLKEKKLILYCPTFRKNSSKHSVEKIQELIDLIDFENYSFIYNPHPLSTQELKDPRIIVNGLSTFEMLFVADIVISDYSTVIYEAGILGLPVYLYAYDWKEYRQRRAYNIDFEKEVPLLFTKDPVEIVNALQRERFDHQEFSIFVQKNIRIPEKKTCCEAIIEIVS